MCSSPEGWIPENMRGIGAEGTAPPGDSQGPREACPMTSNLASAHELLLLARTAAERAAEYLRGVARPADPRAWTSKGRHDFVTEVDRTAETIIAECLRAARPDGRVIGEELSPDV